ncbi:TonB-dependent receptor [Alteromonas pelagimontana]|uniref:TonB-dependent receptor n=1 Tax=Alteromonas pelagimontana TaxID=1858656 RepID=A0A6M4MFH7_9ALTE|nr:TonB-dependent receptor [Alteromonas pelagimontana]QJR81638.1 TonB-dependent receptor [Alteromonas pelagimontana]
MKRKKLSAAIYASFAGISLSMAAVSDVYSQETVVPDAESDAVERIAVVGARGAPRSVTSSPVPVDVLTADDVSAVAFSDMNDVMKTLVPSYTLGRQPIADGAAFIRPASLRGLPTDKTLVLVNSKRRHRSALVEVGGSGTQGPDLAMIPTAAIGSVEVLRDGAAAQYGSDAIAGVINFQLKNNTEGGMFTAEWGQYYEGDGDGLTISGNKGFSLGEDGFVSISAEYSDNDATNRAVQYCTAAFCLDSSLPNYDADAAYNDYLTPEFLAAADEMANSTQGADVVQPWGAPNSEATRVFINAGYMFSDAVELYAFGNYSEKDADSTFYYRYPGNGTIEDIRLEDGSVWNPLSFFPGGFTPRFFGSITDYSMVGGVKGMIDAFGYDISGRYGYDEIDYTISNTINPSLGDASPTAFRPGLLSNEETHFQADFTYDFASYVFAFGLSYLDEGYDIEGGEESSFVAGNYSVADPWGFCNADGTSSAEGLNVIANGSSLDCANPDDPVYQIMGVGANGFPGYSPEFAGTYERDSYAAYIDLSGDITDDLFGQAALRYEDYSDFGSELVYKIAGFYQLNDEVGLRASYGTGFRAPTPGQQGTTNVSTRLPNGFPVATGLFPAGGEIAQALGASNLDPEKSSNITFGVTADYGALNITLDYYRIALEDRLYAISTLDVSADESAGDAYQNYLALVDAGVVGAESIGGVLYFQNAFDTVTEGVDLVANYLMESEYGSTTLTASVNYNKSEFDSDPSEYLNAEDMYDFENGTPETRGIFSIKHAYEAFQVLARLSYYGEYENVDAVTTLAQGNQIDWNNTDLQKFGSEWMFDLEGTYHISENLSLSAGVRNLFDNYPDKTNLADSCCGQIYRADSIVDWQGGYYYTKLVANF